LGNGLKIKRYLIRAFTERVSDFQAQMMRFIYRIAGWERIEAGYPEV
jgi:hypothetical protein